MLNPFFLQGSRGEQGLVQDLINEQLKIYGVEVYYLPRRYVTEKTVMKEVVESEFKNAYPIEAYVDTYDGYGGQGTLLSKFGIQDIDDLTLIISKERYENYIGPLSKDIPDAKLTSRPKEGDLIYFPLGDRLFEIKYVEHEQPFYQLKKNYVYELKCELYRYQDEDIDTDVEFIDDNTEDIGYIQTLQMIGAGSTATATATILNGGVQYVQVTNRGQDYLSVPRVAFSSAPDGGTTAVGIATMLGGLISCTPDDKMKLMVQGVELRNAGSGYTVAPKVLFFTDGEPGSGAEATAYINDGVVGIITVTGGGGGYVTPPTVTIDPPVGDGATATASISGLGSVTGATVTAGGTSYSQTNVPSVTFSDPGDSTGVLFGSWNTEFYISNSTGTVTGSNGSGYSAGTYDLTGGSGTGARLTVTQSSGAITGATGGLSFANGGRDYQVGDVLLIDGGDQNSYIRVAITTTSTNVTAIGTAIVGSSGTITSINITNAGTGYTTAPTVSIANSAFNKVYGTNNVGLVKPIVTSLINSSGIVTAINIKNAGLGYTETPTIVVANPTSLGGSGTYTYNEIVTGSSSGVTGRVKSWNAVTNVLEVSNINGNFTNGESLVGDESGASYALRILNTDNLADSGDSTNKAGQYEDNKIIQTEADGILDFTEKNPFGMP
jgi:hypothetical protein